jgi:uncharacterized protein YyaL (SSP411 family)
MPNDPLNPQVGELAIDARAVASYAQDLPPGEMRGMRRAQPGFKEVIREIVSNQEALGERSAVAASTFENLMTALERLEELAKYKRPAEKLLEILTETEAYVDDQCQRLVHAIATAVEGHAKAFDNPEMLARYERTLDYRSAIGLKAVRKRRQNEKARSEPSDDPQPAK